MWLSTQETLDYMSTCFGSTPYWGQGGRRSEGLVELVAQLYLLVLYLGCILFCITIMC